MALMAVDLTATEIRALIRQGDQCVPYASCSRCGAYVRSNGVGSCDCDLIDACLTELAERREQEENPLGLSEATHRTLMSSIPPSTPQEIASMQATPGEVIDVPGLQEP